MQNTVIWYIHGKGGSAEEANRLRPLFDSCAVQGLSYPGDAPWEAVPCIRARYQALRGQYGAVVLIANSIGAYFAMLALESSPPEKTFLISPVVDMERLIADMMRQDGVTESELQRRGSIPASCGEMLSWRYLCYAREHPLRWHAPTQILYGEHDVLTAPDTSSHFAMRAGAHLTVMPGGEHWFHTPEQLAFLDRWLVRGMEKS